MTDDETKAAAARVRRCKLEGPDATYNHCPGESYFDDCDTLAESWLAEHPADDSEPVTAEWLKACGFESDGYENPWFRHSSNTGIIVVFKNGHQHIRLGGFGAVGVEATRGNTRRLATALGITLTEATT